MPPDHQIRGSGGTLVLFMEKSREYPSVCGHTPGSEKIRKGSSWQQPHKIDIRSHAVSTLLDK